MLCRAADVRLIASRHGGLQWYVIMYCTAAPYGCPTVVKIGPTDIKIGRYAGIASPNCGSALNDQEYCNVYSVGISGTNLIKKNTGAVVPLTKQLSADPNIYMCSNTRRCRQYNGIQG